MFEKSMFISMCVRPGNMLWLNNEHCVVLSLCVIIKHGFRSDAAADETVRKSRDTSAVLFFLSVLLFCLL